MQLLPTCLADCFVIKPRVFTDDRGYFFESFNEKTFSELAGFSVHFVQDNQSQSAYGVVRGLHYQLPPHAQTKLVRVLQGTILDVALDIRQGSPTFGRHFAIELSAENKKQLFIPKGFAHGFSVLSEKAVVMYKCDAFYNKESDAGILFNDPALGIDWKLSADRVIVSDKDKQLPTFANCRNTFTF